MGPTEEDCRIELKSDVSDITMLNCAAIHTVNKKSEQMEIQDSTETENQPVIEDKIEEKVITTKPVTTRKETSNLTLKKTNKRKQVKPKSRQDNVDKKQSLRKAVAIKKSSSGTTDAKSKDNPSTKVTTIKKRRYKPGEAAIRDIIKYQKSTDNLIRKKPFQRLVRSITSEVSVQEKRYEKTAIEMLQASVEEYITGVLNQAQMCAIASERKTITNKDIQLVMKLRNQLNVP